MKEEMMEKQNDGLIVEHGSMADLSIDEQLTDSLFGFHFGRMLWSATAYAEVAV